MNLWVMKFIQYLISYTRSQRAYYLSPAEKFECITVVLSTLNYSICNSNGILTYLTLQPVK